MTVDAKLHFNPMVWLSAKCEYIHMRSIENWKPLDCASLYTCQNTDSCLTQNWNIGILFSEQEGNLTVCLNSDEVKSMDCFIFQKFLINILFIWSQFFSFKVLFYFFVMPFILRRIDVPQLMILPDAPENWNISHSGDRSRLLWLSVFVFAVV